MHVVFEPQITGHRREYLRHLETYVVDNSIADQYVFVIHQNAVEVLSLQSSLLSRQYIPKGISEGLLTGNIIARSTKYYSLAKHTAKHLKAIEFTLLNLNDIQLHLGLFGFSCPVSGILFKPFIRMERNSVKHRIVWWRKYVQTWLLVKQRKVKKIWILNDEWAVNKLNNRFRTRKFDFLPDPVSHWMAEPGYDVRKEFGIEEEATLFIHVGTLSTRKGTPEIIESVAFLPLNRKAKITILIAGKPQPGTEEVIEKALESVKEITPIQIIYKPQYLLEPKLQALFEQCDGILIPYQNTESSSGILSHAILNRKLVLGINKGLMGEIIRKHEAGVLIEKATPENIANGIIQMIHNISRKSQSPAPADLEYKQIHNPKKFAETLLTSVKSVSSA